MNTIKRVLFLSTLFLLTLSCKPKGDKAEVGKAAAVKVDTQGKILDVNKGSIINWEGSKPAGTHTGTINISEGKVTVKGGKVTAGSFTIAMNSIEVTDLEEGQGKEKLESHLKGLERENADDFFNTPAYPASKFAITKITDLMNDPAANAMVYGNLTIKDKVQEIGFKANIEVTGNNNVKVTTPPFTIDRTQWGITFMSKTAMDNLKDKFVNDEIGLSINLIASYREDM